MTGCPIKRTTNRKRISCKNQKNTEQATIRELYGLPTQRLEKRQRLCNEWP